MHQRFIQVLSSQPDVPAWQSTLVRLLVQATKILNEPISLVIVGDLDQMHTFVCTSSERAHTYMLARVQAYWLQVRAIPHLDEHNPLRVGEGEVSTRLDVGLEQGEKLKAQIMAATATLASLLGKVAGLRLIAQISLLPGTSPARLRSPEDGVSSRLHFSIIGQPAALHAFECMLSEETMLYA